MVVICHATYQRFPAKDLTVTSRKSLFSMPLGGEEVNLQNQLNKKYIRLWRTVRFHLVESVCSKCVLERERGLFVFAYLFESQTVHLIIYHVHLNI